MTLLRGNVTGLPITCFLFSSLFVFTNILPAKLKCAQNFVVQLYLVVRKPRLENLLNNVVRMLQQRASPDSAAESSQSCCGEDKSVRGHNSVFQHEHSDWHRPVDGVPLTQTPKTPRRPVGEAF